jgi:hypothetical protein
LNLAVEELRPLFDAAGVAIPAVAVSVGWPSTGGRGARTRRIGECWDASTTADGRPAVFVSPVLHDGVEVLATLVHELVHAAVGTACGHKGPFQSVGRAVGLRGPWRATTAGPELRAELERIDAYLGGYATIHGAIRAGAGRAPEKTRLLKVVCAVDPETCEYTARVSAKWAAMAAHECMATGELERCELAG